MSNIRLLRENWLLGIIICAIIIPMTLLAFDRSPPYEITGGISVPPIIVRGKSYQIDWNITNYPKLCSGTTFRFYKESNGRVHIMTPAPAVFGLIPTDKTQQITVRGYPRELPNDTSLGKIEFWGLNEHSCNFVQRWFSWPIRLEIPPVYSIVVDQ